MVAARNTILQLMQSHVEKGNELILGTMIELSDGEKVKLTGWEAPHHSASSGRVYVAKNNLIRSYFPSVIGAKIVKL